GDNTYEAIKTFTLPGGDYYGGYSDVGDVDGDSIPEIALEGRQTVHIIKAAGNDSFYVWETLPGNNSGSSVRVYDIDGNGLSEVIISGNNQTRIYEYEVGVAEQAGCDVQGIGLTVSPNPFHDRTNIRYSIRNSGYLVQNSTLRIYDVGGRLVKKLHQGIIGSAGVLCWQGVDEMGKMVPQGVYFLRIENPATNTSICRKIIKID
ncbi:MAG: T9SS type A sorting domain-containing protein, partial [bacterium]